MGSLPSLDDARRAIPGDARPQLGELVGRVTPGEHVEHVLELRAGEAGEGVRAPYELVQVVDGDLVIGADRDDLLREHVERVARDLCLLDQALAHRLRDDGGLEQVGAELREDASLRDGSQVVAGPADALQPAGDRLGALDLDHEIDGSHVDPQLERRRGDEARDQPRLQELLDLDALLARERAVVGSRDRLLGELVQPQGEPLGEPPVVDEHDRGAVLSHESEQRGVDRRPDRAGRRLVARGHRNSVRRHELAQARVGAGLAHVLEGDDHLEVEILAGACVDELDRPSTRDEPSDLLQRPLGCGEADALERLVDDPGEPLERDREVGAALRAGDGVHFVDDHRLDAAQHLAALRGEEEIERLGCRDQDVGRGAEHLAALTLIRVARAHADRQGRAEPGERPPQVALDVVVERLQRRDVEQPQPLPRFRIQAIDPGEEGRERLARAGRRLDEDVGAGRDHGPGGHLRGRRAGERLLEPGARRGREGGEGIHPRRVSPLTLCPASVSRDRRPAKAGYRPPDRIGQWRSRSRSTSRAIPRRMHFSVRARLR